MSWGIFLTYFKRNSENYILEKFVEEERIALYSLLKQRQILTVSADKLSLWMIRKSEHFPNRLTILKHRHMWYLFSDTKMYYRNCYVCNMGKIWKIWSRSLMVFSYQKICLWKMCWIFSWGCIKHKKQFKWLE